MKYRLLLLLLAAAIVGSTVLLIQQKRSYARAVYQGHHADEWAATFYPTFDPRATNATTEAFQALGSNAVSALDARLNSRMTFSEKLLLQNGNRLPRPIRRYLFEKFQPGQSVARRTSAARALSILGPVAGAAVPDLISAMNDPAGEIRWAAAQALGRIGPPALPALMAAATNLNAELRHTAVYALGEAGTNAAPAARVLFDASQDTNEAVRASALYSLSRVGPAGVITVLAAFSTEDSTRRTAVIKALQAMNHPPRQVWRTLMELATNSSPAVRREALEGLHVLQVSNPNIFATYVRALDDSDAAVRCTAVQAVSKAVNSATNATFAEAAVRTLGFSGSLNSNIVVKLNGLLTDSEPSVRTAARQALTEIQTMPPD